MLIWAIGVACLVALVAVASRYSAGQRAAGAHSALVECRQCQMWYPRPAIAGRLRLCPSGHSLASAASPRHGGLIVVCVCAGFIAVAVTLVVLGVVPIP